MKEKPTKEQLSTAQKIFKLRMSDRFPKWRFIKKHDENSYKTWKRTVDILPVFIVDRRYLCAFDCGFGHCVVFDLLRRDCFVSKDGIFETGWCFMGDYYGYPEGGFFYKVI